MGRCSCRQRGDAIVVAQPYVGFIDETLALYPRLVGTRVYDMVCERGYAGSLRALQRYLLGVRPTAKHEVYVRLSPLIGAQAQIDWGHVGYLPVPGGRRPLYAFVIVLSYSRAIWGELVLDVAAHSLRRSLVRAAQYFGGCTRQWLFDNPKIVVIERQGDADPVYDDLESPWDGSADCQIRKLLILFW